MRGIGRTPGTALSAPGATNLFTRLIFGSMESRRPAPVGSAHSANCPLRRPGGGNLWQLLLGSEEAQENVMEYNLSACQVR
jgi:hypothetical protein